jgi:hypothetical protein
MSSPLDIDAIAARAQAAPAGHWEAGPDCVQVPWCVPCDPDDFARTDDETDSPWGRGRWLAVREGDWHTGSPDPGPELWEFLAAARGDVLDLVAEVRRLRAAPRGGARRFPRPGRHPRSGAVAGRGRPPGVTPDALPWRQDARGRRAVRAVPGTVGDHSRPRTGSSTGTSATPHGGGAEATTKRGSA